MKGSGWFYIGALTLYIFSFISGFSIGLYVFFGVVLLLLSGLAKSFRLLNKTSFLIIIVISFGVWYLIVRYIDDAYIFYPFTLLF
jgi:hypothetical protein